MTLWVSPEDFQGSDPKNRLESGAIEAMDSDMKSASLWFEAF